VGLVDLLDLVRQIYNIRELVRKVLVGAREELAELERLLGATVELPSVDVGSDFGGRLVIRRHIGEPRALPLWLMLTGKYPYMYLSGGSVVVDSLALHVGADAISLKLKLWYEEVSMDWSLNEPGVPGKGYSSTVFEISMYRDRRSAVPLETLLVFMYLTTDDDWKYIVDELEGLAASGAGLGKVISQLKTAVAALRLVS
jgi:hypothetical protein